MIETESKFLVTLNILKRNRIMLQKLFKVLIGNQSVHYKILYFKAIIKFLPGAAKPDE